MTAARYSAAAMPEPFTVLGLALRPFCIGHYLHLARFDCAFVADGETPCTREDVILAALVCSMTYEEFDAFLTDKNFFKDIKAWGKAVGVFDLKAKAELISKYIADGSKQPIYALEHDDAGPGGGHWTQSVTLSLCSHCGYTRSQALNAPLTQAFSDYLAHAHASGAIRLLTPEEEESINQSSRVGIESEDASEPRPELAVH